ncbi:hypothetical protein [Cellulomonas taurus]|uniref:hypothetical protein n=1 Tax=Cellulomonas taurus TaxID=2729175 RepID=UPI00145C49E6|nr:hypothetical protein [Cellulomonas taurus]
MSTPRPRRVLVLAAATTGLVVALTGCSGGGNGGGGGSTEWTPGALDEFTAKIYGYSLEEDERSQEEMQAESDRQNAKVEELVATCMQEQGFDYTPQENSGGSVILGDDLDVEWGTLEFAQKYGYGISTDPWNSAGQPVETEEYVDANQEYRDSMSESEQAAYDEALYGPPVEYVEGEDTTEYDWTTAGCYGSAQHEVYNSGDGGADYADLEDEINRFYETVEADSRVTALNNAWASCMADEGFDGLTNVNEGNNALYDEYNALQGWDDPEYTAQAESWDWDANPDGPPAPEVDEAKLKAFTDKEIAQAVADFTCQKNVDYIAKRQEVDHELQQEFVDQHRTELQAWADAAEAKRK